MDYKQKYDEALKRAKAWVENRCMPSDTDRQGVLEDIFPELAETEDEKIRKHLISLVKNWDKDGIVSKYTSNPNDIERILAWLEKQDEQEQLYIRFGEIPTDEKSKIFRGEIEVGTENGVSVYPAFKTSEGDIVLGLNLPITKTTLYTQQHLIEYDNRPCYLVKGDYVGKDTDGQPLINNVSIIEKIDTYRVKEKKQNKPKEYTFKSIPRFLDMIEPTERAKAYTKKLINTLTEEGYITDAKIVENCLKRMNGEDVAIAVMDEKQDEQKNKINSYKITFEDVLALECAMKTVKITKGGKELYEMLVRLYNKIHNAYLLEKQDEKPQGKTALEAIKEEKVDNANKVEPVDFNSIDPHFGKPIDKIEPKFHEGEWITNGDYTWKIVEVKPLDYILQSQDGNIVDDTISYVDEQFHSFTIQDAKDGDVLVNGSNIFIFHFINDTRLMGYCHINTDDGRFYDDIGKNECFCLIDAVVNPATKEQRDTLFTKMKEAGYEWDEGNKELKLLITNGGDFESENCEQKPACSEDETSIAKAYRIGFSDGEAYAKEEMQSSWSEDDEKLLKKIMHFLSLDGRISNEELKSIFDWLKSFKDRYTWKPSEEQLRALHDINLTGNISYAGQGHMLIELYNDLKKLTE